MECSSVIERVSEYLDDAVSADERRALKRHFNVCRECKLESERYSELREKLRSLPMRMPPADLTTRLRVVASKVRMESFGGASPWARWRDRVGIVAAQSDAAPGVPAVGGLCSAVFLFSTLVPTFKSAYAMSASGDFPTMLSTAPMLKCTAPVAFSDRDSVVDLQLDDQGQIVGFTHRERARPAERRTSPQKLRTTCCSPNSGQRRRSAAAWPERFAFPSATTVSTFADKAACDPAWF